MKYLLTALIWLALVPTGVVAQTGPLECGTLETNEDDFAYVAKYFTSDTFAVLRQGHIEQVQPNEPQEVVVDSVACDAVHDAAVQQLGIEPSPSTNLTTGSYDFTVYRFGGYFAIVLVDVTADQDTALVAVSSLSPILVFNRSDFSYIFRFAI